MYVHVLAQCPTSHCRVSFVCGVMGGTSPKKLPNPQLLLWLTSAALGAFKTAFVYPRCRRICPAMGSLFSFVLNFTILKQNPS